MATKRITRRRFIKAAAAVSAAGVFAPYIRTSHAAGKLEIGFWDHWVPGANDVLAKLCNEWASTSLAPGTQWSQKPISSLPAACEVRT